MPSNHLNHLTIKTPTLQANAGREQQRLQQELVSVRADFSTAEQTIQHVTAQVTQLEGLTSAHVGERASLQAEVTNLKESLQVSAAATWQPLLGKLHSITVCRFGWWALCSASMWPPIAWCHSGPH